jgi:hypothetical protein
MAQKLSNLPIGAKIKFGTHQIASEGAQPIIWMVVDKNHSGYPSDSVSLITEKIIDFRAYDAGESGSRGNINYSLSNIHQWLNSDGSANNWYTPSHSGDAPPSAPTGSNSTAYQSRPGFLHHFSSTEKLSLLPTTLTVQTYKDVSAKMTAKVFLPSVWEILGTGSYNDTSSRLACFDTGEVRSKITSQAFSNNLVSSNYRPKDADAYWKYYTRSTLSDTEVVIITSSGLADDSYPDSESNGLRPIINLPSNLKISNTPDSDGCYKVLPQSAPTISGSNTSLGNNPYDDGDASTPYNGFSYTYSVDDADTGEASDSVKVTEYIDNVSIRSYDAIKGTLYSFRVMDTTWLELTNGSHTLKITATDGYDTATRTITFTKSVTKLVIQRTTPILASKMPTRIIVTLVKNVPSNSNVTVEVCNNGFDVVPAWEEIETYESGLAHTFNNKTNTAGKWGVNIRVTVDRGAGEGACYISEIGGNFE